MILVPALLGLKGNLEMTLASRLSTQANLGHMDTPKEQWSMIAANLTLIQCQAIVVGFLGSVAALIMEASKTQTFNLDHAFLLCASSLVTASIASFVLGELSFSLQVDISLFQITFFVHHRENISSLHDFILYTCNWVTSKIIL
jgi:cation transporter-like permease